MEGSDQLHAKAPSLLGGKNPVPHEQKAEWAPASIWALQDEKNLLPLLRIEPQVLCFLAPTVVITPRHLMFIN